MYNHVLIEKKWQEYWEKNHTNFFDINSPKKKFYVLDMFPYPSGAGLHLGHVLGYTASDVISRFKKFKGFNVLHPMGWDAFGLPAEQFALKNNKHPSSFTLQNIEVFRKQLKQLGYDYDYRREVDTTDPKFYQWTQWIFSKLYEKGLAEYKNIEVNWCAELGTVLANDEIIEKNGVMLSERGEFPVVKKPMKQWILKITEYADRLIDDLDETEWSDKFKIAQKTWIGRTIGTLIDFKVNDEKITVFTTRVDTIYGVSFIAISPENEIVKKIVTNEKLNEVEEYIKISSAKSELQRIENKEKTGVFTGTYAINPITNEEIPIYVADYVLNTYATGVVMGVPAHDQRDYDFAIKYNLPIKWVLESNDKSKAFEDDGIHINSELVNGLNIKDSITKLNNHIIENKIGMIKKNYKLRDWLFSRQRYWGEPFPILFDEENNIHLVKELPVILPETDNIKPSGNGLSPLANLKEWVNVEINGKKYQRETNTMPGSAGSSWYFLAYLLKKEDGNYIPLDSKEAYDIFKKWMPVDLYIGGAEHATGHLLYARFWHKFLQDLNICSCSEPFFKLPNRGIILGSDNRKMSKSWGNVINPTEICEVYGADALRMYEMFIGPLDGTFPWSDNGVTAIRKFLERVWNLFHTVKITDNQNDELENASHLFIKEVTECIEKLKFNVGVSKMMIFINTCYSQKELNKQIMNNFLIVLSCYSPHIAEELYQLINNNNVSITKNVWPEFDLTKISTSIISLPIQINSKLKLVIDIKKDSSKDEIIELLKTNEKMSSLIDFNKIKKIIYVENRIFNIIL